MFHCFDLVPTPRFVPLGGARGRIRGVVACAGTFVVESVAWFTWTFFLDAHTSVPFYTNSGGKASMPLLALGHQMALSLLTLMLGSALATKPRATKRDATAMIRSLGFGMDRNAEPQPRRAEFCVCVRTAVQPVGARFCKKELGGHFPNKYFLHLTQSSHVLDGYPHFAPPCPGSWHR